MDASKDSDQTKAFESIFRQHAGGKDSLDVENCKKWFKKANVPAIADADLETAFSEKDKDKKGLDFKNFQKVIESLAKEKKMDSKDITQKLTTAGPPSDEEIVVRKVAVVAPVKDSDKTKAFENIFKGHAGDKDSLDVEHCKKWFKNANVPAIADADLEKALSEKDKDKKGLDFKNFQEVIDSLAKEKKMESKDIIQKLATVGRPCDAFNFVGYAELVVVTEDADPIKGLESVYGNYVKAAGKDRLDLENCKNWFKKANFLSIADADLEKAFSEKDKDKKGLDFKNFQEVIESLAKEKNLESKYMVHKLATVGAPSDDSKVLGYAEVVMT